VESAGQPIFTVTGEGVFEFMNEASAAGLGGKVEDFVGKSMWDLFPPEMADMQMAEVTKALESGLFGVSEKESIVQGRKRWYLARIQPLEGPDGTFGRALVILADITEHKKAEEAFRESEEKFRLAMEATNDALWDWNIVTNEVYRNARHATMLGYEPGELNAYQDEWSERIHPDDKQRVLEVVQEHLDGKRSPFEIEYRLKAKSGRYIWVLGRGKVVEYSDDGAAVRMVGTSIDITERKKAEEVIHRSEEKYRGIFDESIAPIYVFDEKKHFIDSNQAGLDLLGYSRDELLSMSIPDVDANPVVVVPAHKQLLSGEKIVDYEHQLRRKDGKIITVLNNSRPITDTDGNVVGMQSTLIDITERKKAERERFEYQERLKAMASQLSRVQELERRKLSKRLHDSISQSLAVARLNLQQSARSVTDSELAGKLDGVSEELRRIMEESYSLMLELSSPILYELGLVSALKALLESRFLEDQGIKCGLVTCEERLGLGRDLRVTLYQAIRELLVNIVKHAKAENVEVLIEKEGECLRIRVKDDGVGFDASEVGLPSTTGGFGLFNLRESLEGIGGELKIESKPGRGTVGRITVPLVCELTS